MIQLPVYTLSRRIPQDFICFMMFVNPKNLSTKPFLNLSGTLNFRNVIKYEKFFVNLLSVKFMRLKGTRILLKMNNNSVTFIQEMALFTKSL